MSANVEGDGRAKQASRTPIHGGGLFNARVYRAADPGGRLHVEKDFSESPWLVRNTVGRFLIFRECWILRRLESTGVVPAGVERVSPFCLREDFCPGFTLRDSCCGVHEENPPGSKTIEGVPREVLDAPPSREFFEALEQGIRLVHSRGFVHLDLHNERNVIVAPGYRPFIIDWQSALPLARVPVLGRLLAQIDLAGVYKLRERFRPGELDAGKRSWLRRAFFWRRILWVPRLRFGNPKNFSSRTDNPAAVKSHVAAIVGCRPSNVPKL